jgi:hypothetical protein
MKHYEVNFVDGTVETVGAEDLPTDISKLMFISKEMGGIATVEVAPTTHWWRVTLLSLDAESGTKLVPHGKISVNLDNVTFIKET